MNTFMAAAAVLSLLGAVLHSVLGERLIFRSLSLDGLPAVAGSALFTRRVLQFFWHTVSVAWLGFAVLLWHLGQHATLDPIGRWTATVIGWTFLGSSMLALAGSRGRHFAWVILLVIAACIWLGLR